MKTEILIKGDNSISLHLTSSLKRHEETGERLRYFDEDLTSVEFLKFYNEIRKARDIVDPTDLELRQALIKEIRDSGKMIKYLRKTITKLKKEFESLMSKQTKGGKK